MNKGMDNNSRIYSNRFQMMILTALVFSIITMISGCSSGEQNITIAKAIIRPIDYCCTGTQCISIIQESKTLSYNYKDVRICDTSKFTEKCINNKGDIIVSELNSESTLTECYPLATDSNNSCSSDNDCIYYCDLESAIKKHNCNDISQLKKDEVDSNGNNLYTTTYLCNKPKTPGICSAAPKAKSSNQEIITTYYMDGNHLIKDEILNTKKS